MTTVINDDQLTPTAAPNINDQKPTIMNDNNKQYNAVIKTSQGNITIVLDLQNYPITADNFIALAKKDYYKNTIFHRVIKGFMIQGGDPKGDGTGGPDKYVVEPPAANTKYVRGLVAMAKKATDPAGTSGSQFFIMHADSQLPAEYAILGKVIDGIDVVDKIANSPTKPDGEGSIPVTPVVVKTITIVEN